MKHFAPALLSVLLIGATAVTASAADAPQEKSVTGTLTDTYCYSTMGASGASHKQCAMGCAKKGIPVGLREKSGKMIILLPPKDAEPLPDAVFNKMEDEVTVTGKEYKSGGVTFLTVESVK
jgi:hypothetical protein